MDRAKRYAKRVVNGKIPASNAIRGVCDRYLRWRKDGAYHYDKESVERVLNFFPSVLTLQASHEGQPFELFDWQAFALSSIYGFVNDDGYRIIRKAWIEIAKGAGKSPLEAGIGLYHMIVESKKEGQEIFCFARDYKQTEPVFKAICSQIRSEKRLYERLKVIGGSKPHLIQARKNDDYISTFSAETQMGKSGFIPTVILADEAMEWDNGDALELLKMNYKNRPEPLLVICTNSGTSFDSYAGEEHQRAIAIAAGEEVDDSVLPLVYSVDSKEDIADEALWIKSNPSLPHIPGVDYIRSELEEARRFPGRLATKERLLFGIWGSSKSYWLDPETWKTDVEIEELEPEKQPCVIALDLGKTRDLTGMSLGWIDDGTRNVVTETWMPTANVEEREKRDNVDYALWLKDGEITGTPGRAIDFDFIAADILDKTEKHNVIALAYDPWLFADLEAALLAVGIEVTSDYAKAVRNKRVLWGLSHDQGNRMVRRDTDGKPRTLAQKRKAEERRNKPVLTMGRSIAEAEVLIVKGKMKVKRSAPLWWGIQTVQTDENKDGLKRFVKAKQTQRIDPVVSTVMAIGALKELELRQRIGTTQGSSIVSPDEVLGDDWSLR